MFQEVENDSVVPSFSLFLSPYFFSYSQGKYIS